MYNYIRNYIFTSIIGMLMKEIMPTTTVSNATISFVETLNTTRYIRMYNYLHEFVV